MKKLLNIGRNAKTIKSRKVGYLTGVLYLAPAELSGREVCPQRSDGCTAACLNTAGRGGMHCTQQARIAKTQRFWNDRAAFIAQLDKEIRALASKAEREGLQPSVRLNGTSDLPWEAYRDENDQTLFDRNPDVTFYDYTKTVKRARRYAAGAMPVNYHITYSRSEVNEGACLDLLKIGGNVAVVFAGDLPDTWNGYPVIDADAHDARHMDARGTVAGLSAKGAARRDTSGFVVPVTVALRVAK